MNSTPRSIVQLLSEEALLIWPAQSGELCQAANEEASIWRSVMTAPFTGHYFHRLPLALSGIISQITPILE